MNIIKKYENEDITVIWEPSKCIHSAICFRNLPQVFNPRIRPWVNMEGGTTEQITAQVNACPSGALSIEQKKSEDVATQTNTQTLIEVVPNGPLLVKGVVQLKHSNGLEENSTIQTALCRCGASSRKPFCDGSHQKISFEG